MLKSPGRGTRSALYGFESSHACERQPLNPSVQNKRTTYALLVICTVDGSSHEDLQGQRAIRNEATSWIEWLTASVRGVRVRKTD
jgi:hypothetical protein